MSYEKILFKKEGPIATITFNDPEKLNPMGFDDGGGHPVGSRRMRPG